MTDTKGTVLVSKNEWEQFLETVEALIDVHAQLLKRLREGKRSIVLGACVNCGRDILENDRYCDHCGRQVVR